MLATILSDQYSHQDKVSMAEALECLCSSNDSSEWSSSGLYCFWNPENSELLYIGLATDLTKRFKQHNGLIRSKSKKGTKQFEIEDFFFNNSKIGFSVFLQSSLDQPNLMKPKSQRFDLPGFEGIKNIKQAEGILIEAYKKKYGCFPLWNKIGGSSSGAKDARKTQSNYFEDLSNMSLPSLLRSVFTLRELADDKYTSQLYVEISVLHVLRLCSLCMGELSMPPEHTLQLFCQGVPKEFIDSPYVKDWFQKYENLL